MSENRYEIQVDLRVEEREALHYVEMKAEQLTNGVVIDEHRCTRGPYNSRDRALKKMDEMANEIQVDNLNAGLPCTVTRSGA